MVYVIAHLKAHAGKADEVVALAGPLIEATRREEGCISYELYRKPADPDMLVFVETWKSRAAVDAHFAEPHLKTFEAAMADLLAEARIEIVHPEKVEVV
ncbi:antibiotic biosynthesis monooxygenase [Sinorhizobium numidicum]|uniref:Antibiotic biosynthesis monooxygenase n=1 Tax=Sinorhizobium numidicum TaxID=680248 RepID=A0ABY8D118_9HYPH|nr:putative quinol monooxygenase [Sinorhizobium numidicum]WEX76711.1 antibiotic biosynthesis monooxygenase [Sinorhizobium numidicum]WEX83372.1 antibiotic biosynthesis monooxygenase [Sinorhizobium numidicum]